MSELKSYKKYIARREREKEEKREGER